MKIMICSVKNKKVVGKFKTETPENIWIDEFVALRSKYYAFKCGESSKNKLKGISKTYSKNNKFDEYKKVWMEWNTKENVIISFFVQLTMKCIFKK